MNSISHEKNINVLFQSKINYSAINNTQYFNMFVIKDEKENIQKERIFYYSKQNIYFSENENIIKNNYLI